MAITNLNINKKVSRLGESILAKKLADPFKENSGEISKLELTKALYKSIIKTRKR